MSMPVHTKRYRYNNVVQRIVAKATMPFRVTGMQNGRQRGFTLIEMIVAVALFALVMLVAVGALLALTGANRKAQALQSVMNNLNIAIDGMVRNARMGSNYHCGAGSYVGDGSSDDCTVNPGTAFSFEPYGSTSLDTPWMYQFVCPSGLPGGTCASGGYIARSEDGTNWVALTAPEVAITSLQFYVVGTLPGDAFQPKVLIVIQGTAGAGSQKTQSTFHIEATAVQRELDLQQTP